MTQNISAPSVSTTQSGAPVTSDAHSQSVGADGAIILTDHYLIEKLAQFNRERVPERVVHAKGGGAFGTFTTRVTSPSTPRRPCSSPAPRRTCSSASPPSPARQAPRTPCATRAASP